ncbi:hypothetical protein D0B54_17905 [Solimonas sp. K1W22B-7]|uniref:hypothetical protein n=1 Tax=Solimonas sp. K1W22B-7 TaxID=2303331 RepID=UPI000E337604|nr:hypothetical protein [Solimonas sp. K1W22B-7]AXQ30435.1 hypothetical protein D0B54_17905 [Solimonas sp. K1W22B-7]
MQQRHDTARIGAEFLAGDFAAQFDDPAFRRAATRFDAAINDGREHAELGGPALYDFANRLFARELRRGLGERLRDGSRICSKRLVAAYLDDDAVVLELDIRARRPDGSEYDYRAPVTRGRTSADTDEVLRIPLQRLRDRLRGAAMLAAGIEQAGGREPLLAQLRRATQPMGLRGPQGAAR